VTIEIVIDDELIEIEEGPENLAKYVHDFYVANLQVKAWQQKKAIASAAIQALQPERKAAYTMDIGEVVISKRDGVRRLELDKELLASVELKQEEMAKLVMAATGFNREQVDPGLKAADPKKWAPTTPLGTFLASCLKRGEPGQPFVVAQVGTRFAEDS
jgi:hypothetical protein